MSMRKIKLGGKSPPQENPNVAKRDFRKLNIPNRGLTIINESGLYSLVLSSKLPQAKVFKRWVTAEVLPSIRRHGAYAAAPTLGGRASPSTLTVCCPVCGGFTRCL